MHGYPEFLIYREVKFQAESVSENKNLPYGPEKRNLVLKLPYARGSKLY